MASDRVKESIAAAKAQYSRLESKLGGMSVEELSAPSACDRWEVRDVVAHLAFVVMFQRNMTVRGLQGDAEAPEGARRPGAADVPAEERIAQGAIRMREKLGDGLLEKLHENYQGGFELVDSLTPDDYDKLCWHPWGPMSVADFVDLVVNELAIHCWDAFSPHDPDYRIAPESLPAALAIASKTLERMAPPDPARYRFELSDGNKVSDLVVGSAPDSPSATLHCDGEALVLLSSGRLTLEDGRQTGRIRVSGDEDLAGALGRALTGL